jgi:hypothetical protein
MANGIDIKNSTPQKYPLSSAPPQTAQAWLTAGIMVQIRPTPREAPCTATHHSNRMSILPHDPLGLGWRADGTSRLTDGADQ